MAETETIFGKHAVRAVLLRRPQDVVELTLCGDRRRHADTIALAERCGARIRFLSQGAFARLGASGDADAPQESPGRREGVQARVRARRILDRLDPGRLATAHCALILDGVNSPQNFGTMLRCAAFFGVDLVISMKDRAVPVNETAVRCAVGGAECVELYRVVNLTRALEALKQAGFWVYGLDAEAERPLASCDLSGRTAFVIGSEGRGLRPGIRKSCDVSARIPGGCEGVESLNAAVAAAAALYERRRRQEP